MCQCTGRLKRVTLGEGIPLYRAVADDDAGRGLVRLILNAGYLTFRPRRTSVHFICDLMPEVERNQVLENGCGQPLHHYRNDPTLNPSSLAPNTRVRFSRGVEGGDVSSRKNPDPRDNDAGGAFRSPGLCVEPKDSSFAQNVADGMLSATHRNTLHRTAPPAHGLAADGFLVVYALVYQVHGQEKRGT